MSKSWDDLLSKSAESWLIGIKASALDFEKKRKIKDWESDEQKGWLRLTGWTLPLHIDVATEDAHRRVKISSFNPHWSRLWFDPTQTGDGWRTGTTQGYGWLNGCHSTCFTRWPIHSLGKCSLSESSSKGQKWIKRTSNRCWISDRSRPQTVED